MGKGKRNNLPKWKKIINYSDLWTLVENSWVLLAKFNDKTGQVEQTKFIKKGDKKVRFHARQNHKISFVAGVYPVPAVEMEKV